MLSQLAQSVRIVSAADAFISSLLRDFTSSKLSRFPAEKNGRPQQEKSASISFMSARLRIFFSAFSVLG